MIYLTIYLISVYLMGLGIVLDQRQAWYWGVLIFILSPVFVPFFVGIKISKI